MVKKTLSNEYRPRRLPLKNLARSFKSLAERFVRDGERIMRDAEHNDDDADYYKYSAYFANMGSAVEMASDTLKDWGDEIK